MTISNRTLRILSLISNTEHQDESTNVAQDKHEQDKFDIAKLPTASVHSIENSVVNESIQNEAEQYRLEQDKLESVNTLELDKLVSFAIPETYVSVVPCEYSVPDNFRKSDIEVAVSSALSETYVGDVPDIEYVQNVH
ncbi:hypothetical protein FQA39_LY17008 [Lamprigera yunnana]|nr:hypothetical protein FQA39_LY17008 [Lamprigera yunnana]